MNKTNKKWTIKELMITFGYSLIMLVVYFAADCIGFMGAFFWIFSVSIIALIAGIPYIYIGAREQHYGTYTIIGAFCFLFYLLSGSLSNIPTLIFTLILMIVPDIIRAVKGYDSFSGLLLAYVVYAFAHIGPQSNVWLMTDWCHSQAMEEMGVEYADKLTGTFSSLWIFVVFILATICTAIAGAFIAKLVLKKILKKYGIIK